MEAFVIKKSKLFLLFISFVILTSYSTTGLAILLIQALVYLSEERKNNKLILPVIAILLVPIYFVFSVNVDDKIQGEKEASFQKRIFDLTQPVFIAMENPLTGIGLDVFQFQKIREEFYISSNSFIGITSTTEVSDKGSSNSVMFLLAGTGFPTTLLLLYMFFKQKIIENKKWLFMIILFISVMSKILF
ncbi:MAG: O-antigen ligase family protein [Polaribacter sp.]|nr:O-antigen ligase family protein [Polaribacter sp.]